MDALRCGICRREFQELDEFMKHKKMLPDLYTCHRCGVFFHYESELKTHNDTHDFPGQSEPPQGGEENFVNSSDTENDDDIAGLGNYANHSIVMSLEEFNRITGAQEDESLANVVVKRDSSEEIGDPIACPVCSHTAPDEPSIYEHLFTAHNMVVASSEEDVLRPAEPEVLDSTLGVDNGERKFVVFEPAATAGTSVMGVPATPKRGRGQRRPKKLLRLT